MSNNFKPSQTPREEDALPANSFFSDWYDSTSAFETEYLSDAELKLYLSKLYFVHDNHHLEECLLKHVPTGFRPPAIVKWPQSKVAENSYYPFFADYLNETHKFKRMHASNVSSYESDSDSKLALLVRVSSSVAATSVLLPLEPFVMELAKLALSFYTQGRQNADNVDDVGIQKRSK